MKQTYRVWAESIDYVYVDIEAGSPEEAMEAADALDGGEFVRDGCDWQFSETKPYVVDEEPMFTYDEILYPS